MDASSATLAKERTVGDRCGSVSSHYLSNGIRKPLSGQKSASLSSNDGIRSRNAFLGSPDIIDQPGRHCIQFLTLLPHQEKLFYLNLFQRKRQYSSNPISHIEHRTKSSVTMEISAFDSPVCRIRISANEKRNIKRVLELMDEYCPVLLRYSNHQELTRVRQSLLPAGSSIFSDRIKEFSNKLPTLRKVSNPRLRDHGHEKGKFGKVKMTKMSLRTDKKTEDDKVAQVDLGVERDVQIEVLKTDTKDGVVNEVLNEELKTGDAESQVEHLTSSREPHEEKEGDLEGEKLITIFDGDAENEVDAHSSTESLKKLEALVVKKPPLPHPKGRNSDSRKTVTSVDLCRELENVVEGYLEREREKVEKMKMEEAESEPQTEQKALDKFRAMVRSGTKPQRKSRKEEGEGKDVKGVVKTVETAGGDEKAKKRKRKRRKVLQTSSVTPHDSRIK